MMSILPMCTVLSTMLGVLLVASCADPSASDEALINDSATQSTPTEPPVMTDSTPTDLPPELRAARERHPFRWFGLAEAVAAEQAASAEIPWRIAKRDGSDLPLTRDHIAGRLNAHVQDGLVIAVLREGEDGSTRMIEGVSDLEFVPFIGHDSAASQAAADADQRPWRVIERDGEGMMVTMDYHPNRVNAVVVGDIVVAASGG